MAAKKTLWIGIMLLTFVGGAGCAIPVRQAVQVDMSAPVGIIEGNQFTGIRYPFKVTAPAGWKVSLEYPKFMIDLGYEKDGLEASQVFLYNPDTQSNVQIDFEPADRYTRFDQASIESLTGMVTATVESEVKEEFGTNVSVTFSPTVPISLKGVSYAAEKHATYTAKGVKRQQGWIYAFTEPYQIFILYMVFDKAGAKDQQALKEILNSIAVLKK
jgi:hypothetical protein